MVELTAFFVSECITATLRGELIFLILLSVDECLIRSPFIFILSVDSRDILCFFINVNAPLLIFAFLINFERFLLRQSCAYSRRLENLWAIGIRANVLRSFHHCVSYIEDVKRNFGQVVCTGFSLLLDCDTAVIESLVCFGTEIVKVSLLAASFAFINEREVDETGVEAASVRVTFNIKAE